MKKRIGVALLLLLLCVVLSGCSSKSSKVDEMIQAIGTVTLDSESAIAAAETAYNELTEAQKEKVTQLEILTSARSRYNAMAEEAKKKAEERQKATDLACRIITKMAKIYKNPLNTRINNVWYRFSTFGDLWLTFELNLTNGYGISQNEYYGITLYEEDLNNLDEILSDEIEFYLLLGSGVRWSKNSVIAMQNGEALDAAEIQDYFMKHYGR